MGQGCCRVLGVAPSGYYAWLKEPTSNRAREDARLLCLIRASFIASHGIYGAPRVFLDLREAGYSRDMYEAPPGGHKDHQRGETAPLQAARRANADQLPEQHAEVEAREVNQEALQDIAMPAQMRAPHPAGLVGVRERTLDALATSAHQALAAGAPNAPTIRIDDQSRRPRSGSATYDRTPTACRSTMTSLL